VSVLAAPKTRAHDVETQVIATTHSLECVRAARDAFASTPDDLGVIRLERDSEGTVRARAIAYDDLAAVLDLGLEVR